MGCINLTATRVGAISISCSMVCTIADKYVYFMATDGAFLTSDNKKIIVKNR